MLPWYDFAVLGPCGQVSNRAVPTSGSSAFPPRRRKNAVLSLLGCSIAADGYMGVLALSCCWQPHLEYPCERTGGGMVAGRCRRGVVPCRQQPFGPCSQGPRRRRLAALFVKFAKLLAWPLSVPQQRIQIPPRPPAAPMPWTSIRHPADTTSPCAGAAAAAASQINNRNTKQRWDHPCRLRRQVSISSGGFLPRGPKIPQKRGWHRHTLMTSCHSALHPARPPSYEPPTNETRNQDAASGGPRYCNDAELPW